MYVYIYIIKINSEIVYNIQKVYFKSDTSYDNGGEDQFTREGGTIYYLTNVKG